MSSSVSSSASTASTATRQHRRGGPKWELCPVPPQARLVALGDAERALLPLPPGFGVRFFSHDLRCLYTVASLHVLCTSGTLDYLAEFNAVGPQKTRSRLFLCTHYDRHGACPDGFGCREVHCELKTANATHVSPIYCATRAAAAAASPASAAAGGSPLSGGCDAPLPPATKVRSQLTQPPPEPAKGDLLCSAVHARTASSDAHPRLPPGVVFRLALPNMHQPIDEVPSDSIFETSGARAYFDHVCCGAPSAPPATNMQHCAHFSKNGLCCFGPDCQFVHVVGCAKFETLLAAAAADGKAVVAGSDAGSARPPGPFGPRGNTDGSASEADDAPRSSASSSAGRRGGGSAISSSSSSAAGGAAAAAGRGGVPKSTPLSFDAASTARMTPPIDFLPPPFLPPPAQALLSPSMFATAPAPPPFATPIAAHQIAPVALPPTAEHLALLQNLLAMQQQQQQQQQQQLLLAAAFVAQQQQQQTAAVTALAAALRNSNEAAATSMNQHQQQLLQQQLLQQLVFQQQQQQLTLPSASYTLAPGTALPGGLVVRSVNGQLQFVPR